MPVIPLGPLREMSGSPNCLSMESISLILSEMNRFLRCSACLIVPRKHLWYIKPCLHSYCKDCLEAMEATCRCRSCERHFSPGRDLVIHRTYGDIIDTYHAIKDRLAASQVEANRISRMDEINEVTSQEDLSSPKPVHGELPQEHPLNEDLGPRSIIPRQQGENIEEQALPKVSRAKRVSEPESIEKTPPKKRATRKSSQEKRLETLLPKRKGIKKTSQEKNTDEASLPEETLRGTKRPLQEKNIKDSPLPRKKLNGVTKKTSQENKMEEADSKEVEGIKETSQEQEIKTTPRSRASKPAKKNTPQKVGVSASNEDSPLIRSALESSSKMKKTPKPAVGATPKSEDVLNRSLNNNSTPTRHRANINKRNVKGETPLHVACCKGDLEKVSQLLDLGADPNNQDNAGWTPLHECAQKGYAEIAEALLKSGVAVSVPGGPFNVTPLHDAAANGSLPIIALLIKKGANKNAMDSKGNIPRSYAFSLQVAELIDSTLSEVTESQALLNQTLMNEPEDKVMFILYFESSKDLNTEIKALIKKLEWKLMSQFGEDVTHVVFSSTKAAGEERKKNLLKHGSNLYLETVLAAKKAVTLDWITKCVETGHAVDSSDFLLEGTPTHFEFPLSRSLSNSSRRLPRLFDGMHFNIHNSVPDKKELSEVLKRGSGIVLKREPDPEFIPESEKRIPYHADPQGSLKACSHYIIYQSGSKREPELKYDMGHIKTLSTDWVYSCIHSFSIISP